MSEIRDYIDAGRRQAEWEEATGRVDHGLYARRFDEDDSGDWHEERLIEREYGDD